MRKMPTLANPNDPGLILRHFDPYDPVIPMTFPATPHVQRLRKTKSRQFDTVTAAEARARGYRPITVSYTIRQYDQYQALSNAVDDLEGVDILLVANANGTRIAIYRK